MDEREFQRQADACLARLEACFEALDLDLDMETKPGGILEIGFADGSKLILNRHLAAREIWVAAKSGGFHFRPEAGAWVSARDGETLAACLARCVAAQAGQPVDSEAFAV